jgi:hypothetical protein
VPWAKLDDRMPWSRKIQPLSDAAFRLYVTGLAWCAAELTDGFISDANVALLPLRRNRKTAAGELVERKLWTRTEGGYMVHDFLEYNRSAARVKQDRQAIAARQQAFRDRRNAVSNASPPDDSNGVTDESSNGVSNASPSRPVPSHSSSKEEQAANAAASPREDVEQVCKYLADRIAANGSRRPRVTEKWREAARLMIDRDKRAVADIRGSIDWSQGNDFWRPHIMSMPKLREKYDTMRLQAERENRPAGNHRSYQNPESAADYLEGWS